MKALLLAGLLLSAGCTTHFKSPVTQIEYKGAITQEGLSITAKPPMWAYCVSFYEFLTDEHQYSDPNP